MRKQRGFMSLSTIGYGILAIAIIAAAFLFQQQRLNTAMAEKETAETKLATANEKLVTVADVNESLKKTIETMGKLKEVSATESTEAAKERIVIQTQIKTITKTLPGKTIILTNAGEVDIQATEQSSLQRITAIQAAFCLASPTAKSCAPTKDLPK